ncbi:MAG: helix-turn-helix transcriptional regulator [Firmicutes bacterium]|nr:helix-turn-helix transcriptional regulator [Bacillota bacterium]
MDFGIRIKELREAAGLSQNELARRAGIAQSGLSYLETGAKSPSIDTLLRICDALGVSLSQFVGQEPDQISEDLHQLIREAKDLTPAQRKALTEFIRTLKAAK